MKIFIWHRLSFLTSHYHTEGGLAVIAQDLARARELIRDYDGIQPKSDVYETHPELTAGCDYPDEKIFVFPDAGCC